MHPNMQRLVELQSLDERLLKYRKDLSTVPARLAEIEARLNAAKSVLTNAQESRTTSLKERKKYELDVKQWRERGKKYRDQSLQVKTNEAYKALQHEIAHSEKEMAQAEDRLLERMVAGEEFERQVKAAERAVVEVERVAEDERKKLSAEQAALREDVAAREAERAKIVPTVPENLLFNYEGIARRRHGVAL